MMKTRQQLAKELASMTRDRDENEAWRMRLHKEIAELKSDLATARGVAEGAAAGMLQERMDLLARVLRLEQRICGLGFQVPGL